MILLLKSVQSYDLYFQVSMGYYVELGPIAKSQQPILIRSRPVGYAAEYLTRGTFAAQHMGSFPLMSMNCILYHFWGVAGYRLRS